MSTGSSGSFTIIVDPLPAGGCVQMPPCEPTDFNGMVLSGGSQGDQVDNVLKSAEGNSQDIVLSPNPNDGTFAVSIVREMTMGLATLYDAKGAQVLAPVRLNIGRTELGGSDLADGTYMLLIEIDGVMEKRTVVVAH